MCERIDYKKQIQVFSIDTWIILCYSLFHRIVYNLVLWHRDVLLYFPLTFKCVSKSQTVLTVPSSCINSVALSLVLEAGSARCQSSLSMLKSGLASSLGDIRHALVAPRHPTQDGTESTHRQLNEHLTRLVASTAASIKDKVTALQVGFCLKSYDIIIVYYITLVCCL